MSASLASLCLNVDIVVNSLRYCSIFRLRALAFRTAYPIIALSHYGSLNLPDKNLNIQRTVSLRKSREVANKKSDRTFHNMEMPLSGMHLPVPISSDTRTSPLLDLTITTIEYIYLITDILEAKKKARSLPPKVQEMASQCNH